MKQKRMKYFLLIFFLVGVQFTNAQKFVLLDMHIAQPVAYTNTITSADKFNGLFPVEKKNIKQFIKALEEIAKSLNSTEPLAAAKQYEIGCVKFTGVTVSLAKEQRLDYVLTSTCDDIKISMHLSDAKISNRSNVYFINTWIKYIKNSIKY